MKKHLSIKPKQIWILSSKRYKDVDLNLKWNSYLPNFVDCNVLIVDLPRLEDLPILNLLPGIDGLKIKRSYENLKYESQHVAEMILLGGTLIVIMMPFHKYLTRYFEDIDNYSWLPIYPSISKLTSGEGIVFEENVYLKEYYIKYVKRYYFEIQGIKGTQSNWANVINGSHVKTKVGRCIGMSVKYGQGLIHFLPPPSNISSKQPIDFIIKNIRERENEFLRTPPPPLWVQNYVSESEKKAIENREKLLRNSFEYEEKVKIYQEINRMIWACGDLNNGKTLENSLKTLFEKEFELNVSKTLPGSHVDLKAYCPILKRKFALEITGLTNKIVSSTKKCVQIAQYSLGNEKEKDEKIILIANTYCDKEIKERPTDNFSPEVEKVMKSMDVCMITTLQLFNLWKEMKEGKITKEKIIEKLYNTNGIFKY